MKSRLKARPTLRRKNSSRTVVRRSHVTTILQRATRLKTDDVRQFLEQQMHTKQGLLETLVNRINDGITVQGLDGKLMYANEQAARLIGFETVDTLLKAPLQDIMRKFELFGEDGSSLQLSSMPGRQVLVTGKEAPAKTLRFRVVETGEDKWSVVSASPLLSESGKLIGAVNVFHDVTEHKRTEERTKFIGEASMLLASSLDYQTILDNIGTLVVPRLADWYSVNLPDATGQLRPVEVMHRDPKKVRWAKKLNAERPTDMNAKTGTPAVFRTGKSEIYAHIPDEMLVKAAKTKEDLKLLRHLGLTSILTVPIVARGRTLGVLSMVYAESGRHYDQSDLLFAEDIGRRIGMAIDNARLYSDAQHEIDERKRSEESFKKLADAMPQIVWINRGDPLQPAEFVNKQWVEYSGGTPEELQKKKVVYLPQEDREIVMREWARAMKTKSSFECQYRLRRKDGQFRWHLARAVPIRDEHGVIVRWFGTATDIHELELRVKERTQQLEEEIQERIRIEERDRANLQRLKSIIDKMPLGVVIYSEEHRVIHVNENLIRMFDLSAEPANLVGYTFAEVKDMILHTLAEPERFKQLLLATIESGEPQFNQELILKSGRILSRDYIPIFAEETYKGHMFLYRDITREKKVDSTKSEFMSLASHQLRTPLTAIRWTFGRLEKQHAAQVSEADRRLLDEGKRATARMSETIDTMLKISKLQSGDIKLNLSDIHLRDFLQEIVAPYILQSKAKKQHFTIDCPKDMQLMSDPKPLKEIVMNLFSNAVKYTPEGGSIQVRASYTTNGKISIDIIDNGYGIPVYQQAKIFSKFFRGDNIVSRETEGTGLGLYLVSLIGQLIGCSISFTSEEGKGTTFTLVFDEA